MTDRLVVMEEELARERNHKQKELARVESKLNRELDREQRIAKNVIQKCQVKWEKERWWE